MLCIEELSFPFFQVISVHKFEHLGFLLYFGDKGSQRFPLSQNTPFFANSDPNMPASPVPAPQVLDWLLENISSAQEHLSERMSTKENGPSSSSDQDVAMADAAASSAKPSSSLRGPCLIEGISKSSCIKQTSDIKGTSVKVNFVHCLFPNILHNLHSILFYAISFHNCSLIRIKPIILVLHLVFYLKLLYI